MQIVNGYLCMNCCDVDKAREGKDPHQSSDQIQKQVERRLHPLAPRNFGPDTIFGGSLTALDGGNGVSSTNGASSNASGLQTPISPPSQGANDAVLSFDLLV